MYKKLLKSISIFIPILLFSALFSCSSVPLKTQSIEIKRLVFLNQTSRALDKVRIYITETREFVSCGYILPKTECSTGFPLREYQGNHFDIAWIENGQARSIKNVQAIVPEKLISGKPVNAVIVFGAQGEFSASLKH